MLSRKSSPVDPKNVSAPQADSKVSKFDPTKANTFGFATNEVSYKFVG
jgi:hypothetical protein